MFPTVLVMLFLVMPLMAGIPPPYWEIQDCVDLKPLGRVWDTGLPDLGVTNRDCVRVVSPEGRVLVLRFEPVQPLGSFQIIPQPSMLPSPYTTISPIDVMSVVASMIVLVIVLAFIFRDYVKKRRV